MPVLSSLNSKLDKADQEASIGLDSENENYEKSLINALTAYQEATDLLKKGEAYKIKIDVSSRMQKVVDALKESLETLKVQAEELRSLGEMEAADAAAARAKAVEEFLNKY